jgi:hypothetical protein
MSINMKEQAKAVDALRELLGLPKGSKIRSMDIRIIAKMGEPIFIRADVDMMANESQVEQIKSIAVIMTTEKPA